jgi:hypothetical protein
VQARWASQLARAKDLGERGNLRRCVATLTQTGAAEWSHERVQHMRGLQPTGLHPTGPEALPPCPVNTPYIIFDKNNVAKLLQHLLHSTAAGPPGWTAERLAPLLGDAVCLDAAILLVQLITNDDPDEAQPPASRITCSVLQGLSKPDSDDLRPLAAGRPVCQDRL